MFKRIIYDDWTSIVPHISFWLTFGVFLVIVVRAMFLRRATVKHLESLPLQEDESPQSTVKSK
jgi:hypothetical protein